MIERYGLEKFFLSAGAASLDRDGENELLSIELPGDPERRMVVVKVRCPSTFRVHFLRVPPNLRRVREAIPWTFGMTEQEYWPNLDQEA
jgi:hypothetical protein